MSKNKLYKKPSSIPHSKVIMKERLRWLGPVLRMKDDKLPNIILFGHPSGAKRKTGRPRMKWKKVIRWDFEEI
jgi:hypothetical protein